MRWTFVALAFVLTLTGCEPPKDQIAFADLDAVARALGRDNAIEQSVGAKSQDLRTQLETAAVQLRDQLQEEQKKLGSSPTEAAQRELANLAQAAQRRMQENIQIAEAQVNEFRASEITKFRDEVKPLAEEIAKARGAKAVLSSGVGIVWFDTSVDITADLIEKMRAKGSATTGSEPTGSAEATQSAPAPTETTTPATPPATDAAPADASAAAPAEVSQGSP